MLSGEGNENGEKTTIGLISKKATLHVQHTFFVHFFAVVLHDYNVKLPETDWLHVLCRKCRTCSCSFFSLPLVFTLVGASISYFPTAATKFSCCSSNRKNVSFVFLSLALALCRSFSRWASLACRLLSLFPWLSLSLYSNFVNMTITLNNTDIETISLSFFVFLDGLLCDFPPQNLYLYLGCHTCWLSYFTLAYIGMPVVRADGIKISRMHR